MTPTALAKRMALLEAEAARLCRPAAPVDERLAWLSWASDEELEEMEQIALRAYERRLDAIPEDGQRRMLALEALALSRMLAGEPEWASDPGATAGCEPPAACRSLARRQLTLTARTRRGGFPEDAAQPPLIPQQRAAVVNSRLPSAGAEAA